MPENPGDLGAVPYTAPNMQENAVNRRALFPEIYYRLKPFISMACDVINSSGTAPTQQDMDDMTDNIYDEFTRMYPDMADYMKQNAESAGEANEAVPTIVIGGSFRPGYGRFGGFRRRGIGRDLISSLLLAELLGNRYPYYPYYPGRPYSPYYPY
jgi:hypothetical protein